MDRLPTDPRVVAMLSVLFGRNWQEHEGDVVFNKGSFGSWVLAVETMLKAADAADPLRLAIRSVAQEGSSGQHGSTMPTRADV